MTPRIALICLATGLVPLPALAAPPALSPQDCAALWDAYGIAHDDCRTALSTTSRPNTPRPSLTAEDRQNNVFFLGGGSDLDEEAAMQVRRLAQILNTGIMRASCVSLVGHADSSGAPRTNRILSVRRADAVADELRRWIDDPSRILRVQGAGSDQILRDFPSEAPENRRVTIFAGPC